MRIKQLTSFAFLLAFSAQTAAFADSYEAWYEAATDTPKSTVIPSKVHTYYDGKKFYTKTTTALGDTIGYYVEVDVDPSTIEYVKTYGAKPLGKRLIKGKECQGFDFIDPIEKRSTESWFDDTGKLYYKFVDKPDGMDGKFEQTRTSFKLNPPSSSLPTDPDITSDGSTVDTTTAPPTIPVNSDDSPFADVGKEKTNLQHPAKTD